jgi:REP element-mobilizing transposase RayT
MSKGPEILRRNSTKTGQKGPIWLADSRIAEVVVRVLNFGANERKLYDLFAYVVMPNHVHALMEPHVELSTITRWLKGRTARIANRLLGRTREPFWHEESYDHIIRSAEEFHKTLNYIEQNPVRAGYVAFAESWRFSSASTDDIKRSSVVQDHD